MAGASGNRFRARAGWGCGFGTAAEKVTSIGHLNASSLSANAARIEAFGRGQTDRADDAAECVGAGRQGYQIGG